MDRINKAPRGLSICLLLAMLTLAAFWPVLHNGFVNYDDPEYVTENPHIQTGLTAANVRWAFTSQHGGNWHPLTSISHMLDVQLFGLRANRHHGINLLLHIINVVLLFLLLERLTGRTWPSASVAALFAVHPLHVESVAWVAERKDVLSTFFFLLTLGAYVKYVSSGERGGEKKSEINPKTQIRKLYYCFALVLFALGLMSKPMLVTLPLLMLLLDFWPLRRLQSANHGAQPAKPPPQNSTSPTLRLVLEKLPFFALAAVSSVLTVWAQKSAGTLSSLEALSLEFRVGNALVSCVRYLSKTIWPTRLAVFYPPPNAWPIEIVAGAAILLLGVTVFVVWSGKKAPELAVGWFWFLCTLVPVIGIVQVGRQAMADRYAYIPSIGLFVAVVWVVSDWMARRPATKPWIVAAELLALASCAGLTWRQATYWRDTASLFEHAIAVTGENAVAENNLGVSLLKADKVSEAESHFTNAVRIKGNYPEALVNVGLCRERAGSTNEALAFYERAVRVQPTAPAYYNLANVLSKEGALDKAETNYRAALQLKPEFIEALYNFGALLAGEGRADEAATKYSAALKLKPDSADMHLSFGALLAGQQKWNEAIAEFKAALQSDPSNGDAEFNLAAAYQAKGDLAEAAKYYAEASRTRPNDVQARENLGILLLDIGKPNEAVACFEEVLRLKPDAKTHYELALAFDGSGQPEKAVSEYREAVRLGPASALYMNDLAWALATSANEKLRDTNEAVRLAEDACRLSGGREPRFFGTLDAAYASAGRFEEAITTAQKTRELAVAAGQKQIAERAEERLALYRARKPYYSTVMPSANP